MQINVLEWVLLLYMYIWKFMTVQFLLWMNATSILKNLALMWKLTERSSWGKFRKQFLRKLHFSALKWSKLWVAKLAEGRSVDSELLDNVLVSVSDCASALLVWWRSGLTLTPFHPLLSEFTAFQMPVCKWTHGTSVLMATWADRASFLGVLSSFFLYFS